MEQRPTNREALISLWCLLGAAFFFCALALSDQYLGTFFMFDIIESDLL